MIVLFDKYCQICKHESTSETEDPCNECLTCPENQNSHKPVYFEEDKAKKKENDRLKMEVKATKILKKNTSREENNDKSTET